MSNEPTITPTPGRGNGTSRRESETPDDGSITVTLGMKGLVGPSLSEQLKSIRAKKQKSTVATSPTSEGSVKGFTLERGLWRLYLLGAVIWTLGILGMVVVSFVEKGRIHRDVRDSLEALAIILPAVLCGYFVLKVVVKFVAWPVLRWVIQGFKS